jgi:hypothetical protein
MILWLALNRADEVLFVSSFCDLEYHDLRKFAEGLLSGVQLDRLGEVVGLPQVV